MLDLRDQTFGVELEFTGITREKAAKVLSEQFGNASIFSCDSGYDGRGVRSSDGRIWKVVRDGSVVTRNAAGERASNKYSCEFVTPICKYEDIQTVQEIVRKFRKAGAKVNDSCGMHVHIGGDKHSIQSLVRLSFNMWAREDILYHALDVKSNRITYCRKTGEDYIQRLRENNPQTYDELADCWYGPNNRSGRNSHYNASRYRALNLHAYFTKGTVEFRCFNSTLHAGEVKSYIQFALGVSAQAINLTRVGVRNKTSSTNECYTFRTWLIKIPLNGEEFETCRYHMLKRLEGAKDWKDREAAMRRRAERAQFIREQVDNLRDEQGNRMTIEQIIERPDTEDVSQGITTRQHLVMLLEDMNDSSVSDEERSALMLILRMGTNGAAQTREQTAADPLVSWATEGQESPQQCIRHDPDTQNSRRRGR